MIRLNQVALTQLADATPRGRWLQLKRERPPDRTLQRLRAGAYAAREHICYGDGPGEASYKCARRVAGPARRDETCALTAQTAVPRVGLFVWDQRARDAEAALRPVPVAPLAAAAQTPTLPRASAATARAPSTASGPIPPPASGYS